ncbi:MAG: hypothetical protein ABSC31_14870 [Acidimicrobiales bacterium]
MRTIADKPWAECVPLSAEGPEADKEADSPTAANFQLILTERKGEFKGRGGDAIAVHGLDLEWRSRCRHQA